MKKLIAIMFATLLLLSITPISSGMESSERINIVATLQIFSYFAKEVGGDRVNVSYIVPQGEDIHSYSLTYKDVKKIERANLIILASSEFFSIDKNIKEKVKGKEILDFEDYNAILYPLGNFKRNVHGYWLYPPNALNITRAIKNKLQRMDPENQAYYENNFLRFKMNLESTLRTIRDMSKRAHIENNTALLTVPGAFYVVKYLGISIEGTIVEGPHQFISEEELTKVKEDIERGKVNYIVDVQSLESSKSGQIAIQLSKDTGVKIVYIDIFSTGNYSALLIKDASRLSSAGYVTSYGHTECNYNFYLLTSLFLVVISVILFVMVYNYRKELLK